MLYLACTYTHKNMSLMGKLTIIKSGADKATTPLETPLPVSLVCCGLGPWPIGALHTLHYFQTCSHRLTHRCTDGYILLPPYSTHSQLMSLVTKFVCMCVCVSLCMLACRVFLSKESFEINYCLALWCMLRDMHT